MAGTPETLFKAWARSNSASCSSRGLEGAIEASQQHGGRGEQTWIVRQAGLDKWQRLPAEHLLDQCRFDVHHSVLEPGLGAGFAIVNFVRVQHHGPARQTVAPATAVLKTLHTGQCVADGVGVVAVKVVAVACKKRLETLKPADVGRAVEPVDRGSVLGHGVVALNSVLNTLPH